MNVRIFWVRAMKCMCAQTRPRFILSSERVFGGMEFEPMLIPREKSPLPENVPRGGLNLWHCGQRDQTLPTSYCSPLRHWYDSAWKKPHRESGLQSRVCHSWGSVVAVCWLLNAQATCKSISGTDLLRQFYVLPLCNRSCRSHFPTHPVTVYWHPANQSQHWPYNARRLAG